MGEPCSGHLLVSHMPLMAESPVGQMNSLPWISQTGAKSPEQGDVYIKNARVFTLTRKLNLQRLKDT